MSTSAEPLPTAHHYAIALLEHLHTLAAQAPPEHHPTWAEYINSAQEIAQFLQSGSPAPPTPPHRLPLTVKQQREFGRLLRDRRNAVGWSRVQLAHKAQLSEATVKFIETARHPPSRASLIRLLNVTALQLGWADVPGLPCPPSVPMRAAQHHPPAAPDSAGDLGGLVLHRLDFDELGDPVFVWRLWGSGRPQWRALYRVLATRLEGDDAGPGRADLSVQTEFVRLRR